MRLELKQKETVKQAKKEAWSEYQKPIKDELNQLLNIFKSIKSKFSIDEIDEWTKDLNQSAIFGLFRRDYMTKAVTFLPLS